MSALPNVPSLRDFESPKDALAFILSLAGAPPDQIFAGFDVDRVLDVIDLESDAAPLSHREQAVIPKESAA